MKQYVGWYYLQLIGLGLLLLFFVTIPQVYSPLQGAAGYLLFLTLAAIVGGKMVDISLRIGLAKRSAGYRHWYVALICVGLFLMTCPGLSVLWVKTIVLGNPSPFSPSFFMVIVSASLVPFILGLAFFRSWRRKNDGSLQGQVMQS